MTNCVASDIRYVRNFGANVKNHMASHPDGSNLQLLNYCLQNLLQVVKCRPTRESLLFGIQSIFSYNYSMSVFCGVNIKISWMNVCGTLNSPKYINHIMCTTTCSGSSHGLWSWCSYPMTQIPSWEASSFSASQEIPCILWNLNFVTAFTSFCQLNPVHKRHPTFWKWIYYSTIYAWGFQMVSFTKVSPPKLSLCLSPFMLHSPPISFLLI